MIQQQKVAIDLTAVLIAVTGDQPRLLTRNHGRNLPSGPLQTEHRSLQQGLRSWVEVQTHHPLGYIEQLYTFADRDRRRLDSGGLGQDDYWITLSYLALTRERATGTEVTWQNLYDYLPWEDFRLGRHPCIDQIILPRLKQWAGTPDSSLFNPRMQRIAIAFGTQLPWSDEAVLQRYEILYEAGLVEESSLKAADPTAPPRLPPLPGRAMNWDHRRILATALARLRAKIKYRPVVFELMPEEFRLSELQRGVEALSGQKLHTQNFRRQIDQQKLVEETGRLAPRTGGRPAQLMRFRRDIVLERAVSGTKPPHSRDH
ncbi:MAG: hypothetical protein ORO03_06795 [Alphaproteobacteria bacterium]|nr:hypothetical protein [Alphaproteobacteria bacterium]